MMFSVFIVGLLKDGIYSPVPSVVCVPVEITFWHIVLNGLDQFYLPLWFEILMLSDS